MVVEPWRLVRGCAEVRVVYYLLVCMWSVLDGVCTSMHSFGMDSVFGMCACGCAPLYRRSQSHFLCRWVCRGQGIYCALHYQNAEIIVHLCMVTHGGEWTGWTVKC